MDRWERRDEKLKKKKQRMPKHGTALKQMAMNEEFHIVAISVKRKKVKKGKKNGG